MPSTPTFFIPPQSTRRDFIRLSGLAAVAAVTMAACGSADDGETDDAPGDLYTIGLYSWAEILFLGEQVPWLGLTHYRIGGDLTDELMTFCAEHNLDVLLNISPHTPRTSVDSDDAFVAAYLRRLETTLTRFGPGGDFWTSNPALPQHPITQVEICNEPNFGYGFSGSQQQIADLYAKVLVASHDLTKKRWPSVTVVAFSVGGSSNAAPKFLELALGSLRAAGRLDAFDVAAVHVYAAGSPPDQEIHESFGTWIAGESIAECKKILLEFGVAAPIWLTESGYQVSKADGGKFDPVATHGDLHRGAGTVSPELQAAYTIRLNMAAAKAGVARTYHMFVFDSDDFNGGWFSGYPVSKPRPVAVAMRNLNAAIGGARSLDIVLDGTGEAAHPFAYRFNTPQTSVLVAWCQAPGSFALPLPEGSDTVVTDMFGTTIAKVSTNSYQTRLTAIPIIAISTPRS